MFRTVFQYNLLITLRQKSVLFWSLAFPLLLSTFFSMAFSNIYTAEIIREPIPVAYVAPAQVNPLYNLKTILGDIPLGQDGSARLFELHVAENTEQARTMVLNGQVAAVVMDGDLPQLMTNRVGAKQVVVKQVLDQADATKQTITSLMRQNPFIPGSQIAAELNQTDYTQAASINRDRMTPDSIYYFALLAMTCLGACSAGAMIVILQQADKSAEGARGAISPASKWLRVTAAGTASWLVQVAMSFIVLAYMTLVLGKHLGDNIPYLLVILAVGTLMGFLLGMAVACMVRGSANAILGVTTSVYMLSSFLSGLMSEQVKRLVDTSLPWLSRINPGTMIVDSMYSLYYYRENNYQYLISMLLACALFAAVVAVTLGRRYHDSI